MQWARSLQTLSPTCRSVSASGAMDGGRQPAPDAPKNRRNIEDTTAASRRTPGRDGRSAGVSPLPRSRSPATSGSMASVRPRRRLPEPVIRGSVGAQVSLGSKAIGPPPAVEGRSLEELIHGSVARQVSRISKAAGAPPAEEGRSLEELRARRAEQPPGPILGEQFKPQMLAEVRGDLRLAMAHARAAAGHLEKALLHARAQEGQLERVLARIQEHPQESHYRHP